MTACPQITHSFSTGTFVLSALRTFEPGSDLCTDAVLAAARLFRSTRTKAAVWHTKYRDWACHHFLVPVRRFGRSTPDNISDKLMSKAAAIFTKVARFGVRLHCSIQPYPTR